MTIPIVSTIDTVRDAVRQARAAGSRIGCVPTMGALHAGHARLIEVAREQSDFVVVTIFVNPTQFGPHEDLAKYPRTLDADRLICEQSGAALVFAPPPSVIYPEGFRTYVDVTQLSDVLCGPSRPGHFRGVATVVLKLFQIVLPDVAVFGQKDAQQARILCRMVEDLNLPVTMVIEPTVREVDGLAMSSRNRYLSPQQRQTAPGIYAAMQAIAEQVRKGERNVQRLETALRAHLVDLPEVRVDYSRILDEQTLQSITRLERPALMAVALFLGTTRLIDNLILVPPEAVS